MKETFMYPHFCGIIHKSLAKAFVSVPINWWTDKENVLNEQNSVIKKNVLIEQNSVIKKNEILMIFAPK